eukprot:12139742-Alexandrium_andersonii.AAC.1
MSSSLAAAVIVLHTPETPAPAPDHARVSVASTGTEASTVTGRLPSLSGVLREDAQQSPVSTPTI